MLDAGKCPPYGLRDEDTLLMDGVAGRGPVHVISIGLTPRDVIFKDTNDNDVV